MSESRRNLEDWEPKDPITAVRLQMMQDLAESAQLSAGGKNVRIYKGVQGGTTIAVDEPPVNFDQTRLCTIIAPYEPGGIFSGYYLATLPNDEQVLAYNEMENAGTIGGFGNYLPEHPLPLAGVIILGRYDHSENHTLPDESEERSVQIITIPSPPVLRFRVNQTTKAFEGSYVWLDDSEEPDSSWTALTGGRDTCTTPLV